MRTSLPCSVALLAIAVLVGAVRAQQTNEGKRQTETKSAQTAEKSDAAAKAAPARPADARQPADPSGSWKWEFETPDDTMELVLKLKWDGKKLDGNYTAFGSTTKVEEGKLDKDTLSFVVRPEFNGNQFEVKFNGTVAKDEIKGAIHLQFGDEPQEFPWTAKRFVDPDDVVGVWDLKIEAPDFGEIVSTLTVTKDDKGLRARYANDFFDLEAKNVQIKENELLFEISSENEEFSFKSNYRGTPRGNAIEGKSAFDFGGNTGEMKFTGKRQPSKEATPAEPARPASARPAADGKNDSKEQAAAKSDGK
jgi:hypothetical protein